MLPQKLLSDGFGTHVANLVIDGLAVCCFNRINPSNRYWEVLFLREGNHEFKIVVKKMNLQSGMISGEPDPPYTVPGTLTGLSISMDHGSNACYEQYGEGYYRPDSSFSRKGGDNPIDFRWVLDFVDPKEVPHGTFDGLRPHSTNPKLDGVTLLKAPYSLFYTQDVAQNLVIMLPRELTEKDLSEGFVFGHMNDLIGACVHAQTPGRVKIKGRDSKGTEIIIKDLPYEEGYYYEIAFTNMEMLEMEMLSADAGLLATHPSQEKVKNYKQGHFQLIYEVIGVTGPEQALWGLPQMTTARLGDCHSVRVNSSVVPTLEPVLG